MRPEAKWANLKAKIPRFLFGLELYIILNKKKSIEYG
jgi:hypothetical protein